LFKLKIDFFAYIYTSKNKFINNLTKTKQKYKIKFTKTW